MELCGCSSCVWWTRSLLNTKGILTLPMLLTSDGSLIQCEVFFFLDVVWCCFLCLLMWNLLSSPFRCSVEMALVDWFLWSKRFLSGTYWFHLYIQLCSCGRACLVIDYVSVHKLQNTPTSINLRCWKLLGIIFSSDLRELCSWNIKSLSPENNYFCLRNSILFKIMVHCYSNLMFIKSIWILNELSDQRQVPKFYYDVFYIFLI